jgi:hypothetical protein
VSFRAEGEKSFGLKWLVLQISLSAPLRSK